MSPYQWVCTNFLNYLDKKITTLYGPTYLILFTYDQILSLLKIRITKTYTITTRQVLANSHINLLLSWTTPQLNAIIPGKFYDYIAVGQPILLLINGGVDPLWEDKFKALKMGMINYENQTNRQELIHFITKLYKEWETGKPSCFRMNEKEVRSYLWAHQMPLFLEKIGIDA